MGDPRTIGADDVPVVGIIGDRRPRRLMIAGELASVGHLRKLGPSSGASTAGIVLTSPTLQAAWHSREGHALADTGPSGDIDRLVRLAAMQHDCVDRERAVMARRSQANAAATSATKEG